MSTFFVHILLLIIFLIVVFYGLGRLNIVFKKKIQIDFLKYGFHIILVVLIWLAYWFDQQ